MNVPFSRAPHIEGAPSPSPSHQAPNAALLVDFDNVTMGMRSDLSKELKTLLASDIIRGKVTVQRAYADWRRYPQYIVPLSEASIDLIFAPAYGSSKKNATDIRMAIDGMELVFTRPEIGTYILLTGDSDFSSLVLKLKEYGKYVIGVGIQESSSDILVQNCDEYYSYTSLSGLRKTDEVGVSASDPWVLVEKAVEKMDRRSDVMRSDRLKQVMLELDSSFDEKSFGFNKFSRFLSEAAKKGLLQLRKMDNGQYEIVPGSGGAKTERKPDSGREERKTGDRGRGAGGRRGNGGRAERPSSREAEAAPPTGGGTAALASAYDLLRRAISDLLEDQDSDSVRDSDVKRRMLALDASFDEAELGFPKFSRFLKQGHDHEVVDLRKEEGGNYQVALGKRTTPPGDGQATPSEPSVPSEPAAASGESTDRTADAPRPSPEDAPAGPGPGRLRPREASVRGPGRKGADEPPPLFEGQVVGRPGRGSGAGRDSGGPAASPAASTPGAPARAGAGTEVFDPATLRLPTGRDSVVQYMSNSYAGVGKKTAETLADALGDELWTVLQKEPSRVESLLPPSRAEKVLEGWRADYQRRRERHAGTGTGGTSAASEERSSGPEDAPAGQEGFPGGEERSSAGPGGPPADAETSFDASKPEPAGSDEAPLEPSPLGRRRGRRTRGGGRSGS